MARGAAVRARDRRRQGVRDVPDAGGGGRDGVHREDREGREEAPRLASPPLHSGREEGSFHPLDAVSDGENESMARLLGGVEAAEEDEDLLSEVPHRVETLGLVLNQQFNVFKTLPCDRSNAGSATGVTQ